MIFKIKNLINQKDEKIEIANLTVLVGPNNSGKSRTLMDIRDLFASRRTKTVLIKSLEFEDITYDEFIKGIEIVSHPTEKDQISISALKPELTGTTNSSINLIAMKDYLKDINKTGWHGLCGFSVAEMKIIHLDAKRRLEIAMKTNSSPIENQHPKTPLQTLYLKHDVESHLSDAFKNAFGMEIKLDYSGLADLKFRVAEKFENIPADPRDAREILDKYGLLDDQGDGFKSFVGIVLGIVLTEGRIVLIDEPEAFLHPAQARVLGEWLAKYSKKEERQIIIATHSADILDGLLLGNNEATIMRVNRVHNETKYHHISSEITKQLSEMPLLSSQPVLDAIFYKGVIVNEGGSDRVIYRSVYAGMYEKREHLFVDAFGKQAIKKIVKPLKDAKIRICTIADLDVLNSETIFKELLEAIDGNDHSKLLESRKEIAEAVEGIQEDVLLQNIKKDIRDLSEKIDPIQELTELRRELGRIKPKSGKWEIVKEKGIEGMPEEIQEKTKSLLRDLKKIGIFLPPVGELESWIKVDNQSWVIGATEIINKGETPENLKGFVRDVINFLEE